MRAVSAECCWAMCIAASKSYNTVRYIDKINSCIITYGLQQSQIQRHRTQGASGCTWSSRERPRKSSESGSNIVLRNAYSQYKKDVIIVKTYQYSPHHFPQNSGRIDWLSCSTRGGSARRGACTQSTSAEGWYVRKRHYYQNIKLTKQISKRLTASSSRPRREAAPSRWPAS